MGDETHPLEYETPPPRELRHQRMRAQFRGVIVAAASVPIGILGLLMLWMGSMVLIGDIEHPPPRIDLHEDISEMVVSFLLGAFCSFVFIHWFSGGVRLCRDGELNRQRL